MKEEVYIHNHICLYACMDVCMVDYHSLTPELLNAATILRVTLLYCVRYYTYLPMYVCLYICIYASILSICVSVYMYVCLCVYVCMCVLCGPPLRLYACNLVREINSCNKLLRCCRLAAVSRPRFVTVS